jgi:predicted Zn finger-like uncharacterized protein
MIVTCPGCASKYRVRNETVPPEGARMRCPKCETLFLAKLPMPGELGEDTYSGFDGPTVMPTLPPGAAPIGFGPQPGTGAGGTTTSSSALAAFPTTGALGPTSSSASVSSLSSPPSPAFGSPSPHGAQRGSVGPGLIPLPSARVEPSSPSSPSWSPRSVDDDPFASVGGAAAHRHAEISSSGFVSPPSSSPSWSGATTTRGPAASARPSPSMTLPRSRPRPPSVAAQAASFLFLFGSIVVAAAGSLVAAWTSGAIDLDDTLMPVAEDRLGVRPPYSFLGHDAIPLDELRRQAAATEQSGDLPAAVVLWARALSADATDAAAQAGHARARAALGEAPP